MFPIESFTIIRMSGDEEKMVIETAGLRIEGSSAAGVETWFRVDPPSIGFDIGRGAHALIPVNDLFVSHPHSDHAAGLIYLGAQRKLNGLDPATVYVPIELVAPYEKLLEAYEGLYGSTPHVRLEGAAPGDQFELKGRFSVKAWEATHTVPARSWELIERKTVLRDEFRSATPEAITLAVRRGESVNRQSEISTLFYSGDTDENIFEKSSALFQSRITILECTFTSEGDQERAATYGHLHLNQIAERSSELECETLILTHFSLRDSIEEISHRVRSAFPEQLLERTILVFGDKLVHPGQAFESD